MLSMDLLIWSIRRVACNRTAGRQSSSETAVCWSGEYEGPSEMPLSKARADLTSLSLWGFGTVYLICLSMLLLCPFLKDFPHLLYLEAAVGVHC